MNLAATGSALFIMLGSALSGLILVTWIRNSRDSERKKRQDEIQRALKDSLESKSLNGDFLNPPLVPFPWNDVQDYELRTPLLENLEKLLETLSRLEAEDFDAQIKGKIERIKKRIEEIEGPFPREVTFEKMASIHDAMLAANIEGLSEAVRKVEEKILSKWDVAKIVFQVLAAVIALTGIIFTIVNYFIEKMILSKLLAP